MQIIKLIVGFGNTEQSGANGEGIFVLMMIDAGQIPGHSLHDCGKGWAAGWTGWRKLEYLKKVFNKD